MIPELAPEELSAALDTVASELLATAGIERPPVDAFAVAAALGITVARDDAQGGRGRYVRLGSYTGSGNGRPTILIRSDPRPQRRQWTVAHEIGEHTAWQVYAALDVDPREAPAGARETVANHLASRLLLPSMWFVDDGQSCFWDLAELKVRYATASHELIARRMLDCPPPVVVSIFDQKRLYFRRSNLSGRVPPPSTAEQQCWQRVHETGRAKQIVDGLCTIHGWAVHEDQWRREILRTELTTVEGYVFS